MACQVFVASRESELVHYWGRVGEGVHYWGGVGEGEFCQRWRIVRSNKQGEISNEIYNTVGIAKTKQKNKVFGCGKHTMEVVLKVVALVELVVLVKPLSVGRVVPSCAGTKVKGDPKTRNGGMTERRNGGKLPQILKRGMAENHPKS